MSRRVLVVGCGYVGGALARDLAASGDDVIGVNRKGSLPEGVEGLALDVLTGNWRDTLPSRFDAVVYCVAPSAYTENAYEAVYLNGLQRVVEGLRPKSPNMRFVMVSSTGVYTQNEGQWVDEQSDAEPEPSSPAHKLREGEQWLLNTLGASAAVVRFGGIYGPGRDRLVRMVREGQGYTYSKPLYTNRIHQHDCARSLAHILGLARPQSIYIGVDEEPADWSAVMRWLAARLDAQVPEVAFETKASARQQRSHKRCDPKALRESGFIWKYKTFREGYEALIASACAPERNVGHAQ